MTSPTKNKTSKENPDMRVLKTLDKGLYKSLYTTLDFLSSANIKSFIDTPSHISYLVASRNLIEEIEKWITNPKTAKIQNSLYAWQTELLYHYNRFIVQVKSQPYSIIIKFLQENFAVDLMQPFPLTPRKRARLQGREESSSPKKETEILHNTSAELPHKTPVARKLIFDFNKSTQSEAGIDHTSTKPKISPQF